MLRTSLILATLTLAACGARDIEERADRLVGGQRSAVISAFGQPDAVDGTTLYYYEGPGRDCAYTFTVSQSGRVLGWYKRGDNCPTEA